MRLFNAVTVAAVAVLAQHVAGSAYLANVAPAAEPSANTEQSKPDAPALTWSRQLTHAAPGIDGDLDDIHIDHPHGRALWHAGVHGDNDEHAPQPARAQLRATFA